MEEEEEDSHDSANAEAGLDHTGDDLLHVHSLLVPGEEESRRGRGEEERRRGRGEEGRRKGRREDRRRIVSGTS